MAQALLSCHPFSWGEPHHFSKLALRLGLFSWLRVGPLGWDYSHSPDVLSSSLPSLQRARYLAKVNFRALNKRCPTVQNKEQAWHLTAESLAQDTGCSSCRDSQESSALSPGKQKNSCSLSFFPFTLKRFMIYCCFIPFTVQKEHT